MKRTHSGMALIESLIAVLILALGIVGAIGMQMRGLTSSTEASMRTEATMAAEQLIGIMWNDLGNVNSYQWGGSGSPPANLSDWYNELTTRYLPGAVVSIVVSPYGATNQGAQVDITISWVPPGSTETRRLATTTFMSPP